MAWLYFLVNLPQDVYVALELPAGGDPSKQYLEAELTYQHQVEYRNQHGQIYSWGWAVSSRWSIDVCQAITRLSFNVEPTLTNLASRKVTHRQIGVFPKQQDRPTGNEW